MKIFAVKATNLRRITLKLCGNLEKRKGANKSAPFNLKRLPNITLGFCVCIKTLNQIYVTVRSFESF